MMDDDSEEIERMLYLSTRCTSADYFRLSYKEREECLVELRHFLGLTGSYGPKMSAHLSSELGAGIEILKDTINAFKAADLLASDPRSRGSAILCSYLSANKHYLHPLNEKTVTETIKTHIVSLDELTKAANKDPIAFDAACHAVADKLNYSDELTNDVRWFAADVLNGERMRPKAKPGPKAYTYASRDETICRAIVLGQEHGLPATRNDVTETVSGCDVAAQFLGENGFFPATFSGVKAIWLSRGDEFSRYLDTMHGD